MRFIKFRHYVCIYWFLKVWLVDVERARTVTIKKKLTHRVVEVADGSCSSRAAESHRGIEMELQQYGCNVFSLQGWVLSESRHFCRHQSSSWKSQVRNHWQRYWQVHQTPWPFQTGVGCIMRRVTGGVVRDLCNSHSNRVNELWKQTGKDLGEYLREWLEDSQHSHAGA